VVLSTLFAAHVHISTTGATIKVKEFRSMDVEHTSDLAQAPDGDEDSQESCSGRRRFLCQVAGAAGSLTLGLSTLRAGAAEKDKSTDVVVKLKDHEKLSKVGGSEVIETGGGGKVIVAHPDETTFVACSAICTHRGGQLFYEHASKQFVCPLHGARFDLNGKVVRGPARQPLQAYDTDPAIILGVEPVA
jgi:Rieske Fe-S protein